jgi:hypothetical protein
MNTQDYNPSSPEAPASNIKDTAAHAWETTRERAGEALQSGERYVRDNPGTSVLSIFGLGFLLGLIVGWSVAHEEHEDYSTRARKTARGWGRKLNLY